jgi:hypothetical protein
LNLGSVGCSTDRGARREHIAVLAEQFVRGERPSYDNERVIDDEQLRQFVAAAGGLGDPVVLVTRSAARLARAWESSVTTSERSRCPPRAVGGLLPPR